MKKISYFLDKRRSKADGTYPVKLLIKISSSNTRNIENISLTEEEWEKMQGKKLRDERLKRIKIKIETEQQRGQQIINDLEKEKCLTEENFFKIFDFGKSTKECISNKKKQKNSTKDFFSSTLQNEESSVDNVFDEFLKANKYYKNNPLNLDKTPLANLNLNISANTQAALNIVAANQLKTAESLKGIYDIFSEINEPFRKAPSGTFENYEKALNSFKNFKPHLKYSEITPQLFNEYEIYMQNQNIAPTTIGIYCRAFRRAIKAAIKRGYIKAEDYPFGKRKDGKYSIPKGDRSKHRALTDDYLKSFVHYKSEDSGEAYAHAITLFSFFCNGMNMRDIFHLQPENIEHEYISFVRRKTMRMTTSKMVIKIPLTKQVLGILEKWGTPNPQKDQFIFPLLNPLVGENFGTSDPIEKNIRFNQISYWLIKKEIRKINRYLLRIEKKINSPIHLSSNIARYSWVNFLDRNGAPLKFIQEGLGHTNPDTTLHYLENLRDKEKNEFIDLFSAI